MGKTLIKVECVDQRLLVSSGPIIASGGRNEDEIEFGFCPLWDEFEKTAVFYREKDQVYHSIIVDNRCVIPHEVLIDEGWLYFGVMGVKGDITRTSEIMKYRVAEGAITEGTKPSDPTPDIYEQILNQLSATNKRLDQMGGSSLEPQPFEVTGNMVQLDNYSGMPMHCVTHIEPVQVGSGDPSPDNVRPITGFTWANLTKCGKNLLPNTATTQTINGVMFTVNPDGSVVANGTNSLSSMFTVLLGRFNMLPNTRYILSGSPASDAISLTLRDRFGNNTYASDGGWSPEFMCDNGDDTASLFIRVAPNATVNNLTLRPMIRLASITDAAYEPYQGETFSANFGQTVYGGMMDWNTGVLTVDRAGVTFDGSENWRSSGLYQQSGAYRYLFDIANMKLPENNNMEAEIISSHYSVISAQNGFVQKSLTGVSVQSDVSGVQIRDEKFKTAGVDAWKAYLSAQKTAGTPVQIVYKLATPTTIRLTPAQITALQGMNNIWCDAGETTVSGRKDILWLTNDLINQIAELRAAIISLGGNV